MSPEDYQAYLTMYGLDRPMLEHIEDLVKTSQWNALNEINDACYCTICGIKKKRKTRHCPNVGLMTNSGKPVHPSIPQVQLLL